MRFLFRFAGVSLCATVFFASFPALAVDGVIEINRARAELGGITPGDTPGYPVTITEPGSYRLTNNLVLTQSEQGIYIDADNVTFDLNGFSISGPVTCTPGAPSCSGSLVNGAQGIRADSAKFLTVKNGTVTGTGAGGISCNPGSGCVVDNVMVSHTWGSGITIANSGRVSNCNVHSNWGSGVTVGTASIVNNNTIHKNGFRGLKISGDGVIVTANVFSKNSTTGIDMGSKITAISGNTLDPKDAGDWFDFSTRMVETGNNFCLDSSPAPHLNCTGL